MIRAPQNTRIYARNAVVTQKTKIRQDPPFHILYMCTHSTTVVGMPGTRPTVQSVIQTNGITIVRSVGNTAPDHDTRGGVPFRYSQHGHRPPFQTKQ